MSLDHRRDSRTVDTFAAHVRDFTERERLWAEALQLDHCSRGQCCTLEDNGADNTGGLIEGNLPSHAPDFKFTFYPDGYVELVEVKTAPESLRAFATFKVSSLRSCVDHDAWLLFPRLRHYYLFPSGTLRGWLDTYEQVIYPKFSPNDLAVRVPTDDLGPPEAWSPVALAFIEKHRDRLTREKYNGS